MLQKNKTKRGQGWLAIFIPLALLNLGLFIYIMIYDKNIAILNPKGIIAHEQLKLFIFTAIVLMVVTLPVILMLYYTAWKYRESNTKVVHDPEAKQGKRFSLFIWTFPLIFLMILTAALIPATHRLEPRKNITSNAEPLTIQVIAMRWKWLFIYPEQNIATVNYVQLPVDRPVTFELTADEAPMSAFWIPNLGGQLYAMTSHVNRLNILATEVGDYPGSSAEINGAGFAGMKFIARASSNDDFNRWAATVKQSDNQLSSETYSDLVRPSEKNPILLFSSYQPDLYTKTLEKYSGSHEAHVKHGYESKQAHNNEGGKTLMREFILGKLDGRALPHEWFTMAGSAAFILFALFIVILLTRTKRWTWLWKEWLTSVDPKKIGIMYFIVGGFMLVRGGLDAIMIWLQQALASSNMPGFAGAENGYLSADHFQQIFTAHGNIMVFFVAMAFIFGLINYIVPLQIGARDLASPLLNTLGFWLFVAGVVMVNMFFMLGGEYAATGWLAVAPLSGPEFSPGVGVDYWIWSLQISGIGTTLGAINFIMTILKMRAPGMSLMKMPLFTWGSLFSMLMAVSVFPLLTATLFLMFLDRSFGTHFFTTSGGGDPMMYTNLIWMWGHPEVYILMLPAFGVFSEVVQTFSRKRIASYTSNVFGMLGVSALALSVWLHHFFTMGATANVNAFFGFMTLIIAIPTSVLFFTWIATMHKGRIRFDTPMLWFLGFVSVFTIGGLSGLVLAFPPVDFQLHNSLFLVAHFHSNVIGGVLFGIFCALSYWFPKFTGIRLNERIGRQAFWCWIIGFCMSFIPMYVLGFMGATRRLDHYDSSTGWQPLFTMMLIGGIIIAIGTALQVVQIIASFMQKRRLIDTTGDPWDGRTLEWATASPPPFYNFTVIPHVNSRDAFWEMKQQGLSKVGYEDIHIPKNTAVGIYISIFAFLIGFAFVWEMYWLAVVSAIATIAVFIVRGFNEEPEYTLTASEVEKLEEARRKKAPRKEPGTHDSEEDMGTGEFIKIVTRFGLEIIRKKKWRKW